jgi:hypothetical protein
MSRSTATKILKGAFLISVPMAFQLGGGRADLATISPMSSGRSAFFGFSAPFRPIKAAGRACADQGRKPSYTSGGGQPKESAKKGCNHRKSGIFLAGLLASQISHNALIGISPTRNCLHTLNCTGWQATAACSNCSGHQLSMRLRAS